MAEAIDLSQKTPFTLVKFTHGGPTSPELFTNLDSDYPFGGDDYVSTPSMEIQLPENDGILQDNPMTITLPLSDDETAFQNRYTCGEPFAITRVEVIEIQRSENAEGTLSVSTVFKGECGEYVRNAEGEPDLCRIEALPLKARIKEVALGLPCNHQCVNILGGPVCKVDMSISSRTLNVLITAIDGSKVTISTLPTGLGDRFYQRGDMTFEGLSLSIHDWRDEVNGNRLEFFMRRKPPESWLNKTVVLRSGCDKTIETCRARYSNEANFLGIGFAIPPYHPNFEDGGALQ